MGELSPERMAFDYVFAELSRRYRLGTAIGGILGAYSEVPIPAVLQLQEGPPSLIFATIYPIKRLEVPALVDRVQAVGDSDVLVESSLSRLGLKMFDQSPEEQLRLITDAAEMKSTVDPRGVLDRLIGHLDVFQPSI